MIKDLTQEDIKVLVERNKNNSWDSLNAIQKAIGIAYVENYNIKDVASSLGLSRENVKKNLRDPLVAAYVADLQEKQLTSGIIKKDFINQHYLTLLDYAMGREEYLAAMPNGEVANTRRVSMPDAINILREMGRSIGYTADENVGKKAPVSVTINLSGVFPDQGVTIDGELLGQEG
jgi:hypothetical protein